MPAELKRKPRPTAAPYNRVPKPNQPKGADKPRTAAQEPTQKSRQNLTLADWLAVFAYIDSHPDVPQKDIVKHFGTLASGPLVFTQSTLSRRLKERTEIESRINDNPSALSSKRPRVVTRPDVERALFLWVKHMEAKGEQVNGPMLKEKRLRFEELFSVPEEERLSGDGWLTSFCRAYKIREHRRHGEAGSVDLTAVEAERARCRDVLSKFAPRDRWNFDETSLFPFAPPDRGLATKQMSGKKKEKFRITLGVACNADGSEKFDLMFIGQSRQPRCFQKKSPDQRGFYYRHNKNAWMTSTLFEEWLKKFDYKMRAANRRVCLFVDNFSGHTVDYEPTNVRLEFFEPNMTSFVQPCDAGVIRCLKALYRREFCHRAIQLDEAGERDIYKINLLEGMMMAQCAWKQVSRQTIANCWKHTETQPDPTVRPAYADLTAWAILREFAATDMGLPEAEKRVKDALGNRYNEADWQPAFKAVMDAENDTDAATAAIEELAHTAINQTGFKIRLPAPTAVPQLTTLEAEVAQSITELRTRNRIFGTPPTLDDFLEPEAEAETPDTSAEIFEGGDKAIVAEVVREMAEKNGEVIQVDDDNDDDDDESSAAAVPDISRSEALGLCEKLMTACLQHGDANSDLPLALMTQLRHFQAFLRREELLKAKQTTLDSFVIRPSTQSPFYLV